RALRAGRDARTDSGADPAHDRERHPRDQGREGRRLDAARTSVAEGSTRGRQRAQLSADPARLAPDELRVALLDERGQTLLRVLAREELSERGAFGLEVCRVVAAEGAVGELLHQPQGDGAL